jgi:3-oxoacyl-[acyl-carrier protein] reductase
MDTGLRSRVAVVTGGASGIGRAIVANLLGEGVHVAIIDVRQEEAAATARALGGPEARCLALIGDVSQAGRVRDMMREALDTFGRIDFLVNNAAVSTRCPMEDLPEADWDRVLAVNLKGTFLCIQAVLPVFRRQGAGAIVNLCSSVVKSGGHSPFAHYVASKAGIWGLTKHVARHAAAYGVRCNAVAPGTTATTVMRHYSEEERRKQEAAIPLGRIDQPDEVANVVLFLLSDGARYITGELVDVNGGTEMD